MPDTCFLAPGVTVPVDPAGVRRNGRGVGGMPTDVGTPVEAFLLSSGRGSQHGHLALPHPGRGRDGEGRWWPWMERPSPWSPQILPPLPSCAFSLVGVDCDPLRSGLSKSRSLAGRVGWRRSLFRLVATCSAMAFGSVMSGTGAGLAVETHAPPPEPCTAIVPGRDRHGRPSRGWRPTGPRTEVVLRDLALLDHGQPTNGAASQMPQTP